MITEDREAMHYAVEEYTHDFIGEDGDAPYIHEEIDHPEKRSVFYEAFKEWYDEWESNI